MNENSKKYIIRAILITGAIISIISLYLLITLQNPARTSVSKRDNIEDIQIGGNFELIDHHGNIFNSERLKGKLSLVYFGFTYCPDICPTTLRKLSTVIETLSKYNISINPVFITVDPTRDTISVLKEYIGHFNPNFTALTGNEGQIRKVADLFKVYYAKAQESVNHSYMLDHSSFVYLLDKRSKYLKHFSMSDSAEQIIEFIRVNGG